MTRLRLQYQIALATFLPLIIFALLSGAVGAYALRQIPENLVLQRQLALTQVAAAGVAGNLKGYVRLLEITAADVGDASGDLDQQGQILRERSNMLNLFSAGVILLDAQGTAVAATETGKATIGLNYTAQPYFQEVQSTQAPIFSTVFRDRPSGFDAVVVAVPVRHNGAFAGTLLGELSLSRHDWARDLNLLRTPEGGSAYLIDSASTIIYHPDAARIGKSVQSDPDLWRMVISGQARSMLYLPPGSEQPAVVTFAPVPGITWGLITEEPWEAILAPIVPYEWLVVGLMILGMGGALAALVLSVKRVTRPMNALIAAGQQVAEGGGFHPLPIEGPPDMRTLLRVINQMVKRLVEQQSVLRSYALQVLHSQENERLRIARDLHDDTAQNLIALTQRLDLCTDLLEEDPAAVATVLHEVHGLAQQAVIEVRRMSNNLRPSILQDLGLAAGLEVLTRDLGQQMPQADVHCQVVGREVRLPPELEVTTFRIAQEALTNVRKHAPTATQVSVALFFEDWGIMLMVEDNGPGFEAQDRETLMRQGHLGLAGMVERAQLFNGELRVNSATGEGATISLRLPLPTGES